jgi:hypothetical protein
MAAGVMGWGVLTIREYLGLRGRNPFEEWAESLDSPSAGPEVAVARERIIRDGEPPPAPAAGDEGDGSSSDPGATGEGGL